MQKTRSGFILPTVLALSLTIIAIMVTLLLHCRDIPKPGGRQRGVITLHQILIVQVRIHTVQIPMCIPVVL